MGNSIDSLLLQPTGRLWLVIGKSGLGKTTLLERWAYRALKSKKTPIFIPLGSEHSAKEEVAAVMAQYGDVEVSPAIAFDLLKEGNFVILLDGFNEDRTPVQTRDFVRLIARRNHVIMTSQFDPNWHKVLESLAITLEPFGRAQLERLMDSGWVDRVLSATHLVDIAQLPQTAQLLATFINKHGRLPDLRLDIYRNLTEGVEGDLQSLNLQSTAWDLFRENRHEFAASERLTKVFCDSAVECGILTRVGDHYKFRHERIHRFFVACYLCRQAPRSVEDWHAEVEGGLGKLYWSDTLELWGELYVERVTDGQTETRTYYKFLNEAMKFSPKIFSDKLYPQLQRMYQTGTLQKDPEFIERIANQLAETTASISVTEH